jgi:hypothetical protein
MAATKTAKSEAKKLEKAAKETLAQAQHGLTKSVGQAKASAAKALRAADKEEKALTRPFVEKLDSAWKRVKKAVK